MLFPRDRGGNEDAQMADALMDRVDDRLPVTSDFVIVLIEIENPSECLLGRRDVVAFRAEHHDRRADVAQVNRPTIRGLYPTRSEIIADEQLIDDELDLL